MPSFLQLLIRTHSKDLNKNVLTRRWDCHETEMAEQARCDSISTTSGWCTRGRHYYILELLPKHFVTIVATIKVHQLSRICSLDFVKLDFIKKCAFYNCSPYQLERRLCPVPVKLRHVQVVNKNDDFLPIRCAHESLLPLFQLPLNHFLCSLA